MDRIAAYFGDIPPRATAPPPVPDTSARLDGERFDLLTDRVQLPRIYLAYTLPAYGEREWYAADLLSQVLTAGKASRLYRDLVYDRELAQSISCYTLPTETSGSLHLVATARPGVGLAELGSAVDEHLAAAAETPVPEAELERVRKRILTGYFSELQTLERRADLLSQFTTYFDRPEAIEDEIAAYQEIDAGEIQAVASRLRVDDRARLWVEPEAPPPGGRDAGERAAGAVAT
jgi:predicted Zn-dependent peptidase